MDRLLNLLVTFAGLIGMVPPKLPCSPLGKYHVNWYSIGGAYCLLLFAGTATILTDYLWNNGTNYFGRYNITDSPPPSVEVINITIWVNYLVNIFITRLNTFLSASHFALLLRNLNILHVRLDILSARSHCKLKEDVRKATGSYKVMGCVTCMCLVVNQMVQSRKYYKVFTSEEFTSWWLPKQSKWTSVVELIPDVVHCLTIMFALLQFLLIGISLLNLYSSFGSLLKHLWRSTEKMELIAAPRPIAETFALLQESMMLYTSVCGVNMLILIITNMVDVTWVVYGFYLDGISFGMTSVMVVALIFVTVTSFGDYFETKVSRLSGVIFC